MLELAASWLQSHLLSVVVQLSAGCWSRVSEGAEALPELCTGWSLAPQLLLLWHLQQCVAVVQSTLGLGDMWLSPSLEHTWSR